LRISARRTANIIALATEGLKSQLLAEVDAALDELHLQGQQLEFQQRRAIAELQKTNVHRLVEARKEMDDAKEKHDAMTRDLQEQRVQIEALEAETPVVRGQIETDVEIAVGDNLAQKLVPLEIIVRDDVVIEIRDGC
jgi:hypothetical protein